MSTYDKLLDPDVPMHHQIYMQLRNEILDGLWVGRPDFPGDEELAEQCNVSIITSRQALMRLAKEGLIRRERGRRPAISYDPNRAATRNPAPTMLPVGAHPFAYTVLACGVTIVPAEACAAFSLPAGSQLWSCSRLRRFQGRPHSVSQSVQRPELGNQHSLDALGRLPMVEIVQSTGRKLSRLSRRLSVALPSANAARHLSISLQRPTLVYTYVLTDQEENVIEWVRIYVHPDEPSPFETMNLIEHTWESLDVV
jgi:GntR family transcriptional regulator